MQTIGARREERLEASVVKILLCSSTYHTRLSSLKGLCGKPLLIEQSCVSTLHKTPHRINKVGRFSPWKSYLNIQNETNVFVMTSIPHIMGLLDHVASLWQTLSMKVVSGIYLEFSSQTKHALEPGVVPV